MLKHCIILNGPPGSGKDTIANLMTELPYPKFNKHQFKEQLYIDTALYFGVDVYTFVDRATNRANKEVKWLDLKLPFNQILTPREALIHVSENVIKPKHGNSYFGDAAAQACIKANSQYAVFSDGGFIEEIKSLLPIYEHVHLIHLHREGFDFSNDSRNYVMDFPDITQRLTLIDGKPHDAVNKILEMTNVYDRPTQEEVLASLLAYR